MKEKFDYRELASLSNDEARQYIEKIRWPDGPFCPHCGCADYYKLNGKKDSKSPVRSGVYKCSACRKQYTVTIGTIFEGSHIGLGKWLAVIHLVCASKKGMSALQVQRMFNIGSYQTAWFMLQRIRYAMTQSSLSKKMKGIVEADETYVGGKSKGKRGRGAENKEIVFTLVERDGKIKSTHVANVTATTLKTAIRENVDRESTIMTDEFKSYGSVSV